MGILIAYFIWVASVLAVIVTAWIGIADSGVANVHLRRAAIHRNHDEAVLAEGSAAARAPQQTAKAETAKTETAKTETAKTETAKTETAKTAAAPAVANTRRAEARVRRSHRAKARAQASAQAWQAAHSGARFGWRPGQPLATDPRFALGAGAPFGGY